MIAGVLRETASREQRVALTPADAARLLTAGIRVVVEREAGRYAGFSDADYHAAGAVIAAGRSEVFEGCDLVAWVKPPAFALDSMPLRAGMVLLGFQDPLHRRAEIAELRARGIESVAFEHVRRDPGSTDIDALSAMSRIAGGIAYREGRALLPQDRTARPIQAMVLGCGEAGLAALGAAGTFGDRKPIAIGNRREHEAAAIRFGAGYFVLNPEGDRTLVLDRIAAASPDLIICTAVHRGAQAPLLLDDAALDALATGAVVVDLVAKAGGNCSAVLPDATVQRNGVTITHRSNYPSDQPHSASRAFGAATAAMIRRIVGDASTRG
ncbi:hypothetical protein [Nocardia sp. NPDC050710]|uniref:hypothetical protein n=1 Tax=Nocardia sp. NPDC050710 TaxID=3157220 RepID=UPI0033ED1A78